MSSKTEMECYNSGWQDGYVKGLSEALDLLSSEALHDAIEELEERLKEYNHEDV